ncbi:hypothetical protein CTI12_AA551060 [Artemisia annua]|uniref:Uncharacterized protein n=1 Tax=Artemisia annua TaxID=35608 RepID=A0A2U1KXU2_ARTAN|nr:hypothetical protein CTI12_AA551060 [Artemisia annua]
MDIDVAGKLVDSVEVEENAKGGSSSPKDVGVPAGNRNERNADCTSQSVGDHNDSCGSRYGYKGKVLLAFGYIASSKIGVRFDKQIPECNDLGGVCEEDHGLVCAGRFATRTKATKLDTAFALRTVVIPVLECDQAVGRNICLMLQTEITTTSSPLALKLAGHLCMFRTEMLELHPVKSINWYFSAPVSLNIHFSLFQAESRGLFSLGFPKWKYASGK